MTRDEIIAHHLGTPETRTGPATLETLPKSVLGKIVKNIWRFGIICPKPPTGSVYYDREEANEDLHTLDTRPLLISKRLATVFTDVLYGKHTFKFTDVELAGWFTNLIGPPNVNKLKCIIIRLTTNLDGMGVSDERRWELFATGLVPLLSDLSTLSLDFSRWHSNGRNTVRGQGMHSDEVDEDHAYVARKCFIDKMSEARADACRVSGGTWLDADDKEILRMKITGEWSGEVRRTERESGIPYAPTLMSRSRLRLGLQADQNSPDENATNAPANDNDYSSTGVVASTGEPSAAAISALPVIEREVKPKKPSWTDRLKNLKLRGLPARGSKEHQQMVDEYEATGEISDEVELSAGKKTKDNEGAESSST